MMSTLSAADLSPRTLGAHDPSASLGASSTSSNATVVPHLRHDDDEIDPRILKALSTDPSSLPVEFYGALSHMTSQQPQNLQPSPLRQNQKQSQTSLNSRQSQVNITIHIKFSTDCCSLTDFFFAKCLDCLEILFSVSGLVIKRKS